MSWNTVISLFFIGYACLPIGCSQTPVPTSHLMSTQKNMCAAHHWDVLAQDVAVRVDEALDHRNALYGHRLFVQTMDNTSFGQAFRNFLLSHLLKQSRVDVVQKNKAACHLMVDTQVVEHASKIIHPPWKLTALGSGVFAVSRMAEWGSDHLWVSLPLVGLVGDLFLTTGMYGMNLNTEVIISTSLWHDDQLIYSAADVYYIQSSDRRQYEYGSSKYQLVSGNF